MTASACRTRYDRLRHLVDKRIASLAIAGPRDLRDACAHVLTGGGKRVRGVLAMLACEAVGGSARAALDAGTAVELMHNFTLVHDDIIDHAASRRGRPTVHVQWDVNTALLVGDVLLGEAYATMMRTHTPHIRTLTGMFTTGLLEVCEGQAMDLEFEQRTDIGLDDYFQMIEKKTGRLIVTAADIGGVVGEATRTQRSALRRFARHLGRAFQIQDDLLDVIADQKRFGKVTGGDIMEGKRTFLLLAAARRARGIDQRLVARVMRHETDGTSSPSPQRRALVADVAAMYDRLGILEEAERFIRRDTLKAAAALEHLPQNGATDTLRWLSEQLSHRVS